MAKLEPAFDAKLSTLKGNMKSEDPKIHTMGGARKVSRAI